MNKLILLTILLCSSCTNTDEAYKTLKSMGYKDIMISGFEIGACAKDDWYSTGFTAKNAEGMEVKGTFCSGLFFKKSTVRF
jgi:hypothetical protein